MMVVMSKRLAWLALLLLAPQCEALAITSSPTQHVYERALSDFTFATYGGGQCSSGQRTQIEKWLGDVATVADKAIQKLDTFGTDENVAYSANRFLAVKSRPTGQGTREPLEPAVIDELKAIYRNIARMARGQFRDTGRYQATHIFCGDDYQKPKQGGDWAQDAAGNLVSRWENGQQESKKINQLAEYARPLSEGKQPYYIPTLGTYMFQPPGQLDHGFQCGRSWGFSSRFSNGRAMVTLCTSGPQGSLFQGWTGDVMSEAPPQQGRAIDDDWGLPRSNVLFHEFVHLVRDNNDSPHAGGNQRTCFQLAERANFGFQPADTRRSPQCVTEFAMAMWYLDNTGNDPVVYWAGNGARASAARTTLRNP